MNLIDSLLPKFDGAKVFVEKREINGLNTLVGTSHSQRKGLNVQSTSRLPMEG